MKVAVTVLALVATAELVLGVTAGYGPPQPLPPPPQHQHQLQQQQQQLQLQQQQQQQLQHNNKYRPPSGGPPGPTGKFPAYPNGGHFGKPEFYSKYNLHSAPPGARGPPPPPPPPFAKFPPGKPLFQQQQHQQHLQQQKQQQPVKHHQQLQLQKNQKPPHQLPPNFKPLPPQFQSKPHLIANSEPAGHQQQHQGPEQRLQQAIPSPSRPTAKITNNAWPPKPSGPPDFGPRFPPVVHQQQQQQQQVVAAASHVVPAAAAVTAVPLFAAPFPDKPRGPYIINSDDERGPIKTIPAPNLNPADKPANFEEQLYRAQHQHQQSFVQPLQDNSIVDDKPQQSYQVTEDPNVYKQFIGQPDSKVPLDVALQQHLDKQQPQLPVNQETLTPQELYSLLNGNPAATVGVPQTTYMVPQTVMYAVPQPQPLDMQVGHQLQYQPQTVPLQYAPQPAVQLQYAQPAGAELQYLQPQAVQYQPQAVQYQSQAVQYQYQQQQQQQPAEQYGTQPTVEESTYREQQQQQQQQDQQQQQQQQDDYLQKQPQDQQLDNDVQYQQDQDYDQPRNNGENSGGEQSAAVEDERKKFQSIRDQYYSAVPNEQTADVLAQIAQSAANNDADAAVATTSTVEQAVGSESAVVEKTSSAADLQQQPTAQAAGTTSVQIQQSVPIYEGSYTAASSARRTTNQEYADEDGGGTGGEDAELMEGSESVAAVSTSAESSSVNGHAPSQFPYNASRINAFAAN